MDELVPFTYYEFRLKAFHGTTPSDYSNRVLVQTLETLPEKVEDLHGYMFNDSALVIHWTPPPSPHGLDFVREMTLGDQ